MVPDRQKVRTDGRRQNYIPPTSSGDKKYRCVGFEKKNNNKKTFYDQTTVFFSRVIRTTGIFFLALDE